MILVDANILVYAWNADAQQHRPAAAWLEDRLNGVAGVGLPCPDDWDSPHWPGPQAVADGMAAIVGGRDAMSRAARRRAVERFDLGPWIARHGSLFEAVLEARR